MTKLFRLFTLGVFALLLLLAGCSDTEEDDEGRDRDSDSRPMPITALEVEPRTLSRQLSLSGRVRPRVTVDIAARTSGAVDRVLVDEGDAVERGDTLAQLDMSEARAELGRSEAEEERARLDYERVAQLRERDVATATEYQTARADLRVAENTTELWRTRVNYGEITAPKDAMITARHIEPGEAVQNQDVLFELAALDELVIRVGVPERDVVHLHRGLLLPVRIDAMPDALFEGRIRLISPMPRATSQLTPVEILLPPDAYETGVRPGFLARIQTPVDRRAGVLAVPSAAIGISRGERYVMRVEDDELKRTEVETGVTRGDWTEIAAGIEAGDTILATNPLEAREGQSVRVVERGASE